MTSLHDPAFAVRRVLWLAYGVLGIALIFCIAAIVMLRDHHVPAIIPQPPAAASPSASPALTTQNPPTDVPSRGDASRAQTAGGGGQLSQTGGTRGEPPGDVEDDSRGGSSSASGALPLPTQPPAVVPSVVPSVLPSLVPAALPSPPH
ncbi:MAG TPA: hypothetical protein VJT14_04600 [Candidatus Dormibacteraeota bacterium]|nr:hypothetical protein [Candidatus Dormibacteraeota bacterium]